MHAARDKAGPSHPSNKEIGSKKALGQEVMEREYTILFHVSMRLELTNLAWLGGRWQIDTHQLC
jgi:hypothetical protein